MTEYQGFDIKRMIKHLYRKYQEGVQAVQMSVVDKNVIIEGERSVRFKYTNQEEFYKEIAFLILIFATRGSNWLRIVEKSSEEMKAMMEHFQARYNFDTRHREPGSGQPLSHCPGSHGAFRPWCVTTSDSEMGSPYTPSLRLVLSPGIFGIECF